MLFYTIFLSLEFSFGDPFQSYGLLANGSPNYQIQELRLNSESIWKDAVEYSSLNMTVEQCLFDDYYLIDESTDLAATTSTCNIDRSSSIIGFPVSTSKDEYVSEDIAGNGMLSCEQQMEHCLSTKRTKNNEASKKFRKARKTRHEQLYIMEDIMLKENSFLKDRISALEKEIESWKQFFKIQN